MLSPGWLSSINLLAGGLDVVYAGLGLLLVMRMLLQAFGMRWTHPLLQVTVKLTDPLVGLSNRLLGLPSYGSAYRAYRSLRSDILSSATALIVLWVARSLTTWLLRLALLLPRWVAQPLDSAGAMARFVLGLLFDLYGIALFVRVLFSWVRGIGTSSALYSGKTMRFLWAITEPVLAPIRQALSSLGPSLFGLGLDLSPLIAFLLLRLVQQIVFSLLSWIL
jgi:YggT family protein